MGRSGGSCRPLTACASTTHPPSPSSHWVSSITPALARRRPNRNARRRPFRTQSLSLSCNPRRHRQRPRSRTRVGWRPSPWPKAGGRPCCNASGSGDGAGAPHVADETGLALFMDRSVLRSGGSPCTRHRPCPRYVLPPTQSQVTLLDRWTVEFDDARVAHALGLGGGRAPPARTMQNYLGVGVDAKASCAAKRAMRARPFASSDLVRATALPLFRSKPAPHLP
jgi:hypothetical protein